MKLVYIEFKYLQSWKYEKYRFPLMQSWRYNSKTLWHGIGHPDVKVLQKSKVRCPGNNCHKSSFAAVFSKCFIYPGLMFVHLQNNYSNKALKNNCLPL